MKLEGKVAMVTAAGRGIGRAIALWLAREGADLAVNSDQEETTAAVVAREECVCCGICANVCPEEAITVCDLAVINPQKCTGCGACVDECPNNAISLVNLEEAAPQ